MLHKATSLDTKVSYKVGMVRTNVCYLFCFISPLASAHGKNRYFMLIKNACLTGGIEELSVLSVQFYCERKIVLKHKVY